MGFLDKVGTIIGFFGGGGGNGDGFTTGLILIGTTYAISSSSRLSTEGSLSEPELAPSSLPIVILINSLFSVSSFSKSPAFNLSNKIESSSSSSPCLIFFMF